MDVKKLISKPRGVRMTGEEYTKFMRLGGGAWLRLKLRNAKPDKDSEILLKLKSAGVQNPERFVKE